MKILPIFSILLSTISFSSYSSSYITGNLQYHSNNASKITSTLEAGHTFSNYIGGFTIYSEIDGISLGKYSLEGNAPAAYLTIGGEQSFNFSDNFWAAIGYQHLLQNGESIQYRPLIKLGYIFDNGISISNRTRAQIDATNSNIKTDIRLDNNISYNLNSQFALKYNNVYMIEASTMDHELRTTWVRDGVQPYIEYRNQNNNSNNVIVLGASYSF